MNPPSTKLFSSPVGGYRRLDSFTLATIVQIETWRFCQDFLDLRNDPKGRWFDQMTQAARSGRANLIEGSENAPTACWSWSDAPCRFSRTRFDRRANRSRKRADSANG